jgi:hypothetical protein
MTTSTASNIINFPSRIEEEVSQFNEAFRPTFKATYLAKQERIADKVADYAEETMRVALTAFETGVSIATLKAARRAVRAYGSVLWELYFPL